MRFSQQKMVTLVNGKVAVVRSPVSRQAKEALADDVALDFVGATSDPETRSER
jgi:hypothetical protein